MLAREYMPAVRYGAKWLPSDVLGSGFAGWPQGNIYYVVKTTDAWYNDFVGNYGFYYPDGTYSVKTTIQAGVDATTANRGDIVFVGPGKWTEEVKVISKPGIRIIGTGYGTGMQEPGGSRIRVSDAATHYPFTTKLGTACQGAGFHILSRNVEITGFYIDGSGGYCGIYLGGGMNGGITGYTTETTSGSWIHGNYIRGGGDGYVGLYMNGSKFGVLVEDNVFERWAYAGIEMDAGNASCESDIIRRNTFLAANAAYGIRIYGEGNSCLHCNVHQNIFTDGASLAFTQAISNSSGSTGVLSCTGNWFACANMLDLLVTDIHSGNFRGTKNTTEVYVDED